ncbi:MAG: hypothetical protein AAGD07_13555 [Planctomycetota bacterium]
MSSTSIATVTPSLDGHVVGRSSADTLFPLPLTPLEQLLRWDESPGCPLTSFIELRFDGQLDRDVLQSALDHTSAHHPLVASRIERVGGRDCWVREDHLRPVFLDPQAENVAQQKLSLDGVRTRDVARTIDLSRESGCRFWLHHDRVNDTSRIVIQVHHACSDGVGMRQFIVGMMKEYANEVRSRVADTTDGADDRVTNRQNRSLDRLQPKRLLDRNRYLDRSGKPLVSDIRAWQKLKNAHYFFLQRPVLLADDVPLMRSDSDSSPSGPHDSPVRHAAFSVDESAAILDRLRRNAIGLNDLAISLLLQTCSRWNQAGGKAHAGDRLRLLFPIDLRSRNDLRMPACNRLSFGFIGRTIAQCHDLEALIAGVHSETERMKKTRLHMDLLNGMNSASHHPRFMRWATRRFRNMSTVVLTYAGDVMRGLSRVFPDTVDHNGQPGRQVGDCVLTDVFITPPPRDGNRASLGICFNGGRMSFSLAYDPRHWDRDRADAFLGRYHGVWQDWLGAAR